MELSYSKIPTYLGRIDGRNEIYFLTATGFVERIAPKVVRGEAVAYSSGVTP